jgi:hypothetical protein
MSSTAKQLRIKRVPIGTLHPNPWNPNRMDERTYQAERESIRLYGFIDPCTVRPHPTLDGEWEIIDGEHRWKAAQDEGRTDIDIIPLALDDAEARKLTVIFNETRGEADVALLGKLLSELQESMDDDALGLALPYTTAELEHLLEIGKHGWDDFGDGSGLDQLPLPDVRNPNALAVVLDFDSSQRERFDAAMGRLAEARGYLTAEQAVLDTFEAACSAL